MSISLQEALYSISPFWLDVAAYLYTLNREMVSTSKKTSVIRTLPNIYINTQIILGSSICFKHLVSMTKMMYEASKWLNFLLELNIYSSLLKYIDKIHDYCLFKAYKLWLTLDQNQNLFLIREEYQLNIHKTGCVHTHVWKTPLIYFFKISY